MAHLSRFGFLRHLRAEPNQFILHFRKGKLIRSGAGLAYWFNPLNAAVAQIPGEDCETTFMIKERSSDFQEVNVQMTLTYRFSDPERAAARVNFSIALDTGVWVEQPLERLANLWSQRSVQPARVFLKEVEISEAIRTGADVISKSIRETLLNDTEIAEIGMTLVNVQVDRIAPTAELEKALQTPTRESIQQKADEAVFSRRAQAVEKERAIKENELVTEIELAHQQEQLIKQQGSNQILQINSEAEAEKNRIVAQTARQEIVAKAEARDTQIRAQGRAESKRLIAEADLDREKRRLEQLKSAPNSLIASLVMEKFAEKISTINHLNLSPDLFSDTLKNFLDGQAKE
jgi:regulator of protease activity HflC (stomatin/prohibitin superfamily)